MSAWMIAVAVMPWLGVGVVAYRAIDDARTWREAHRDLRALHHWEREQNKFLRKQLEDERKRHQEGPYR